MTAQTLKIIGLTGSIATGKSAVADILRAHGFAVLDADDAAKTLSAIGGAAHGEIARAFPESVQVGGDGDGDIDRKKLAGLVFADKKKLAMLEGILHPKIKTMRDKFYEAARARGDRVVFVMVPLLFEKGIDKECNATWVITCHVAAQRERALARAGMTDQLLSKILASQMPDSEKIQRADVVIENNGTMAELKQKVEAAIKNL